MSFLVPPSTRTAPERRIVGSAFRLGGLALAVAPRPPRVGIPRQRVRRPVSEDRRTDIA